MKLQIALDDLTMEEALVLMDTVQNHVDIIEIGTPFIYEYGMEAVRTMKKRYPDKEILADMKIMDAGYYEAEEALKAGADYVTVLAVTDLDLAAGKEQLHPAFFAFWPGPLTLVLKARAGFFNPKLVDARGKIALRVTPHPAARALAQTLGGPITATSANLQGRPPARLAGELDPDLLARLDCVFDAGPEPQGGLPSTIVEPLGGLKARILREGAVPACALAKQGIALA